MMFKPFLACIAVAGIAGCTPPDGFKTVVDSNYTAPVVVPTPQVSATATVVDQARINATCADIASARGSAGAIAGIADLRAQAAFSESELGHIALGEVATGMSERAAICALGGNSAGVSEVKTITSPGHVAKVFTFSNIKGTLHTDNGLVTVFNG